MTKKLSDAYLSEVVGGSDVGDRGELLYQCGDMVYFHASAAAGGDKKDPTEIRIGEVRSIHGDEHYIASDGRLYIVDRTAIKGKV